MNKKATQGRLLISMLKRKPMTTMEMLQTGISVSPWKRISEQLLPSERLVKAKSCPDRRINVYRVVKV